MATKSQITFNKKQKEKKKAMKKKAKMEKRASRKEEDTKGLQINWDIAPKNRTLTPEDKLLQKQNKMDYLSI